MQEINEVVEVVDSTEQVSLRRSRSNVEEELTTTSSVVPMIYSIKVVLKVQHRNLYTVLYYLPNVSFPVF